MELQTFTAASMSEAYELVRGSLGEDALIVSTQTFPRLGGASQVEVVAGLPVARSTARPGLAGDFAAHGLVRALAEDAAAGVAESSPEFVNPLAGAWRRGEPSGLDPVIAGAATDPGSATDDGGGRPVSGEALLAAIEERTRAIEANVQWLASRRANAVVDAGPSGLREVHDRLLEHGVPPRLLVSLIQRLEAQLREDASTREVMRVTERALAALLPPPPRIDVDRAGQVIYVVGPHGAGKTSVALRLAREVAGGRRAIVAGTDVDRAGAPQQLLAAAAAAGVEARLCYAPAELKALLKEEARHVVIVDTPAQSGHRSDRMLELKAFAQVAPRRVVLLVLPATAGATDALRTSATLAPLAPAGVVATRVDDGAAFGGIVAALLQSGAGLAYTTFSADVSMGLAHGDNHALALAVLTGLWPGRHAIPIQDGVGAGA